MHGCVAATKWWCVLEKGGHERWWCPAEKEGGFGGKEGRGGWLSNQKASQTSDSQVITNVMLTSQARARGSPGFERTSGLVVTREPEREPVEAEG